MAQAFPPRIRGTQLGLKNPALVDQLKAAMRAGQFHFHEIRAQVGGVRDRKGVYHVVDGHHRIVAAWEIWLETADAEPLKKLLEFGNWDEWSHPPRDSRPLPLRSWWGRLRNRLGYLRREAMESTRLRSEGFTVDSLYVPPFELRRGEAVCLHMPSPMDWRWAEKLVRSLIGQSPDSGIHVHGRILS